MKTADEIIDMINNASDRSQAKLIVMGYAHSIIDECVDNFECTIESDNVTGNSIGNPVLVRSSVLAVKNMIK